MKYIIIILLPLLATAKYIRKDWGYPNYGVKRCLNTRARILKERSLSSVKYKNKKNCVVSFGLWNDYYYDEQHTDAKKVEIDHLVPLYHAYQVGAEKWSKLKKKAFANDPMNLVITNKKYNRKKGAKTILKWLPIDRGYACKYMKQWFVIKNKYKLRISTDEKKYFALAKCD